MDAMYTGNRIFELRKERGLSQKELAEKMNVTDKAVSKWERGLNYFNILFTKMFFCEAHRLNTFKSTNIIVFFITDGHVFNKNRLPITAVPYVYTISISISEIFNNGAYHRFKFLGDGMRILLYQ